MSADAPPPTQRWGFMVGQTFVEVPKHPLELAGLTAPCTVAIGTAERHIIVEPAPEYVLTEPYLVQTWWQVGFQRAGRGGTASGATPEIAMREAIAVVQAKLHRDATHAR